MAKNKMFSPMRVAFVGLDKPQAYRDKDGKEIDVLIHENQVLYPVEIKKTASPSAADIRHFGSLGKLGLAVGPGVIVCLARETYPLGNANIALPAWTI